MGKVELEILFMYSIQFVLVQICAGPHHAITLSDKTLRSCFRSGRI